MTTDQTSLLDEIAERVARMEEMWTELVDVLGFAVGADRSMSAEECGCIAPAESGHRPGCTGVATPCPMHEPGDPDCSPTHGGACTPPRTFTLEAARWVCQGDVIQAVHGDTGWAEVLHQPVRTADMTGLVTDTGRGQRMRWWAHDDLIKVETPPVPDPTPFRSAR